jgi:hypothetical protein
MRRRSSLLTSARSTRLGVSPDAAWGALVSTRAGRHWYADAPPLVLRQSLDRLVGGPPAAPLPHHPELATGDRAGLWWVAEADAVCRRLVLEARVRAPGVVVLTTTVLSTPRSGCEVRQAVSFAPAGVVGMAYLISDLPVRELAAEWVHRQALADVRTATGFDTPGGGPDEGFDGGGADGS